MGIVEEFFVDTFSSTRPVEGIDGNETQQTQIESGNGLLTKLKDRSESYEVEMFGKEYRFYTRQSYDIKIGDILTINSVDYGVRDFDNVIPDMFEGTDEMQVIVLFRQSTNG